MKVVQINSTSGAGSTGKICSSVSKTLTSLGIENYILYSTGVSRETNSIKFCKRPYQLLQALKGRIFGNNGFNSHLSTKKILKILDRIKPDIVHLHNLHSNDINLLLLFNYFKHRNIQVFYTFHDCWAFTAYCPHFTISGCQKWITGCCSCPVYRKSSWFFDNSISIWNKKKIALSNFKFTIITPSKWLANLVGNSFLSDNPIQVINNGIDLNVFKPSQSTFKEKYKLNGKIILLGVAYGWSYRKGLDVFVELSKRLPDKFAIVLVGTSDKVDRGLPSRIISIHRTQNQRELAEIYSAADLLINPSREENFPTVNIESLACGTPIITFNTGGSPEIINEKTGLVVSWGDIDSMEKCIIDICENNPFKREDCIERAKSFDQANCFKKYVDLYLKKA